MALKRLVSIVLLTLMLGACRPAKMVVPPGLENDSDRWPVNSRNYFLDESFQFGPYRIANVHRGWTTTTTWGLSYSGLSISDSDASQKYEFEVAENAATLAQLKCATNVSWNQAELNNILGDKSTFTWRLDSHTSLVCSMESGGGWKLVTQQGLSDRTLSGVLSNGRTELVVTGTRELEGGWPLTEASGYIFSQRGEPVAAVEVLNDGEVWIRRELSRELQQAVIGGATALLLYREIGRN